jgi:hypothetical protein
VKHPSIAGFRISPAIGSPDGQSRHFAGVREVA